jgi:alpha-amylase/alpha-mannosidase (GH57 family)
MILPNPEYHRLFKKHQSNPVVDIRSFSSQEYSDLMALFNLAWFDPTYKNSIPELKKLVKKGKNYTTEDRQIIIEIQRNIIRQLILLTKNIWMPIELKSLQVHITTRFCR